MTIVLLHNKSTHLQSKKMHALKQEKDKIFKLISLLYTYHSDMNVFFERFAIGGLRGTFVIARVVSAGLLYIESSRIDLEILDGGEIPAASAPPDLTRHVELAY